MSSYIKQIQANLKEAGFYQGLIDGVAGKLTVQAVALAVKQGMFSSAERKVVTEQNQSHPELVEKITPLVHKTSQFTLSSTSLKRLEGVDKRLVEVVKLALEKSKQDFVVVEGLRTMERQRELVKKGASMTMNSKHLTGHAVDLAPLVKGKVSWNWNYFYAIAEAMRDAAEALDITVVWGGIWKPLNMTTSPAVTLVEDYMTTCRETGKKAFLDGPHFELRV